MTHFNSFHSFKYDKDGYFVRRYSLYVRGAYNTESVINALRFHAPCVGEGMRRVSNTIDVDLSGTSGRLMIEDREIR